MAKNRSAEKEEFWRLALVEQQASGMTIKAFCVQQGLAAHAFSWWKREIKKRDQRRTGKQRDNRVNETRLIPVTVTAQSPSSSASSEAAGTDHSIIEVVSPTGYKLRIKCELPPPHLTVLLDAVTACKSIGGTS